MIKKRDQELAIVVYMKTIKRDYIPTTFKKVRALVERVAVASFSLTPTRSHGRPLRGELASSLVPARSYCRLVQVGCASFTAPVRSQLSPQVQVEFASSFWVPAASSCPLLP